MNTKCLIHAASIAGAVVFLMAATANAAITFNTNGAGTGFGGTSLTLDNSSGAAATLIFIPDADITTGVPSNVNFGNFTLVCADCSTQALGSGSRFAPFTFDLVITDLTNNASGRFLGTSQGGTIYANSSSLSIIWSPLQLGPGINLASTGSFGSTVFTTTAFTGIVAPNSGAVPGQSTVQGFVAYVAVPEPGTLTVIGLGLVGLGLLRRRVFVS